jgi:hypothetical protein
MQPALPDLASIPPRRIRPSRATKSDPLPFVTDEYSILASRSPSVSPEHSRANSFSTSEPQPEFRSTYPTLGAVAHHITSSVEDADSSPETTNLLQETFREDLQSAGFTMVRQKSFKVAPQPTLNEEAPTTTATGSRYSVLAIEEPESDDDVDCDVPDASPPVIAEKQPTNNKKKNRKPKKNKKKRTDVKPPGHGQANAAPNRYVEKFWNMVQQRKPKAGAKGRAKVKGNVGGGRRLLNIILRPEILILIAWVVLATLVKRIFKIQTGHN